MPYNHHKPQASYSSPGLDRLPDAPISEGGLNHNVLGDLQVCLAFLINRRISYLTASKDVNGNTEPK